MPNLFAPVTGEVDVNANAAGTQSAPAIARLGNGGYVVVWTDGGNDVYGQRFDEFGTRVGGQVEIATGSPVDGWPSVTALTGGGFAVVYDSYIPAPVGAHSDVRIRLFGADGAPLGESLVVHASSNANQNQGNVTRLADGSLIVTWSSYAADQSDIEVWGRKLDAAGTPIGEEFRLSSDVVGVQSSAVITALPDGGFIAVWQSVLRHGIDPGGDNTYDVYARRFDSNGQPSGGQFLVNTYTLSHQLRPQTATLADGSFVILWESQSQSSETDFGVWGQRFHSDGSRIGGEFRVPNITGGDQGDIAIAPLDSGGFAVSWMSYGTDGSGGGIYARIFDASASPVGDQFLVNVTTSGDQFYPAAVALANGRLVVTWQSPEGTSADSNIQARTFSEMHAPNDFNGDGRSDILWRDGSGAMISWLGQSYGNYASNAGGSGQVPTAWQVTGTGDFNGDGRDDILWRDDAGAFVSWLGQGNGSFVNNVNGSGQVPTNWFVTGTGDFNGDGRDDILWRDDAGAFVSWLGHGNGTFANNLNGSGQVPTNWFVTGTGDFNGDGRDDILWRSNAGAFVSWFGQGNGSFANNVNGSGQVSGDWHVAGTGDFNGDGRDDILWRSDAGEFVSWLGQANGGFVNNPNGSGQVSGDWHVAGTGDYNGDGRDDILWHRDGGAFASWWGQANGGFANNLNGSGQVASDWHVQPNPAGLGNWDY